MSIDPEFRRRLEQLARGLLPEPEALDLRSRIDADPGLARAYAEILAERDLPAPDAPDALDLREESEPAAEEGRSRGAEAGMRLPDRSLGAPPGRAAPRPVTVPFVARAPGEGARVRSVLRTDGSARAAWARWANWVVGISAGVFLLISLGGYLYHRGQLADIAAEHLRLMVSGPARIRVGVAQRYTVTATTVTGHAVPAQVEFTMIGPDGQQAMAHKETADERGAVEIAVQADARWPAEVRMEVAGTYLARTERVETRLAVEPVGYLTALFVEQPCCRPGETLRYRSLTLSRLSLAADRPLPIRFEVRAPDGSLVAHSAREGETVRGVGWGEFPLPGDLPDGAYAVVAISPDNDFPEVRREFAVRADRAARPEKDAKSPADRAARAEKDPKSLADRHPPGGIQVRFRPEGGELVAGMENRVYFSAREGSGKPARFSGRIVDGQGRAVAAVETSQEGMGSFQFEPQATEQYRLKIESPPESRGEVGLPPVSGNHGAVLTIGLGVLEPGAPLEFNVRATAADLPLVAAVWCRGVQVGQQTLVTSVGANSVVVPLNDDAAGALRLALYEYRSNPPKLLAERLIYRRPAKRLDVRAVVQGQSHRPGESAELAFRVTDEQGRPVPAALSIAVVDATRCPSAAPAFATARSQFLLLGEIQNPQGIENADSYLSSDRKAAVALDLLLGSHARQQPTAVSGSGEGRPGQAAPAAAAASPRVGGDPPMVLDNLAELLGRFRESLASYHENRTRILNTLTTLSFFGGTGLVVFVAMLSLLNIPTGLRLWGPSLGVAAACVVIGAVLMDPERLKPNQGGTVAFTSHETPPPPGEAGRKGAGGKRLQPFIDIGHDPKKSPGTASLFWRPLVTTDEQGQASVRVQLPGQPATYRILIDAHGDGGRMGGSIAVVSSQTPSRPEPPVPGAKSLSHNVAQPPSAVRNSPTQPGAAVPQVEKTR